MESIQTNLDQRRNENDLPALRRIDTEITARMIQAIRIHVEIHE